MKYTKRHRENTKQREQTWLKFKKQVNQLSAHKRGVRRNGH
ncbi:hypothetical protein [Loigolactobacillus rennini]|uniref:Uncharacterized protein n=1 Tax=Loigolactobacillus rennini TaxID=238013 RepID=A0A1K2I6H2_9LACO|nr:hypothetical protein [Loigolactobacillus rennini]SFZ87351.1 hypothetical protein LREN565_0464 [Loigolactobacillus rennini]